jgi:2-amino-4-hydroxy-6-hydroxymethyldihydropteridine diphosphokinase
MNTRAYIGLGSNIEPRQFFLNRAIDTISLSHVVVQVADVIETLPEGFDAEIPFLNTVVEIETEFSPRALLTNLKEIENTLGRTSKSVNKNYSSRTIDLDILYFGSEVLFTPDLIVPHPEIVNRFFVLEPLVQIAPHFKDPLRLKSVKVLLNELKLNLASRK